MHAYKVDVWFVHLQYTFILQARRQSQFIYFSMREPNCTEPSKIKFFRTFYNIAKEMYEPFFNQIWKKNSVVFEKNAIKNNG